MAALYIKFKNMNKIKDWLIFGPDDVDLAKSPLRTGIDEQTYVLGAFPMAMSY